MKSLYKCEKCGKVFEDYEECGKCEESHWTFTNEWTNDGLHETLNDMVEYKEGQEEPNIIHVLFKKERWENGEWIRERRCGKYKLISSYDAPLVVTEE